MGPLAKGLAVLGTVAVVVMLAVVAVACGPLTRSRQAAVAPHLDTATGDFGSLEHRLWGQKAGEAMSVMRGFLDSMRNAFVVMPATHERVVAVCGTAVPHLPELEAAVPSGAPDPELGKQVNEAVSGFEQYIRSCAAGDDADAQAGFNRYDQASQAVYNLVDQIK